MGAEIINTVIIRDLKELAILAIVILIIAVFTYYTSVAQDQAFGSRFWEMALISVGVAVLSFVVGILAKSLLGVDI